MNRYIIGIDEVGRGPLAGPVTVCAAAIPRGMKFTPLENGVRLDDSKKLTAKSREAWVKKLKKAGVAFAVTSISPAVIDRVNISRAANLAVKRSLKKLTEEKGIPIEHSVVFLDGGLFVEGGRTMIKADQKINAVRAASVLAKVHRDRYMKRLSIKYPAYGFERHVGYGTRAHLAAIKKHGLSPVHRKTFCKFV
ncbi:ribonuclease HII [Patescibacteria group bacterium]|nr:ribonuclease HII [Patescibacteria group bacterium]MCL5114524.1 ribonuclease HII [Patescibacteria group bacterium]